MDRRIARPALVRVGTQGALAALAATAVLAGCGPRGVAAAGRRAACAPGRYAVEARNRMQVPLDVVQLRPSASARRVVGTVEAEREATLVVGAPGVYALVLPDTTASTHEFARTDAPPRAAVPGATTIRLACAAPPPAR